MLSVSATALDMIAQRADGHGAIANNSNVRKTGAPMTISPRNAIDTSAPAVRREQALATRHLLTIGPPETDLELGGYSERYQAPAGHRPAHHVRANRSDLVGEIIDHAVQLGRSSEHGVEVEPEVAVVAGLEDEVTSPSTHQRQQIVGFHE